MAKRDRGRGEVRRGAAGRAKSRTAGEPGQPGGSGSGPRPGKSSKSGKASKKQVLQSRIVELLEASPGGRPVPQRALARQLGLQAGGGRLLSRMLDDLAARGLILDAGQGRFKRPRRDGLVEGRVSALHGEPGRDEGASVIDGGGRTWRLPRGGEARVGDLVLIQPIGEVEAGRAELVRAIGGAGDLVVGILERGHGQAEVTPYRDDAQWSIAIPEKHLAGARAGEVVAVEPIASTRGRGPGGGGARPVGRVVERIGRPGEPEADFRAVVWHRRLPVSFPEAVLSEIEGLPDALSSRALEGRRDLRDRDFITIDPLTARDHDDAVCVEPGPDGGDWLVVAIADVAHYVRPGTALDREAERRGNSVYFPDRAIPMLPERLSGDLCSLRPDVDRLAMGVRMLVDRDGRVQRPEFFEAVIRSRAKLTYEAAAALLEGRRPLESHAAGVARVAAQVEALGRVARRLQRRRMQAGALDFELPEPVVKLDDRGRVLDIVRSERTEAHRAIEEAMLAANRAVAQLLVHEGRPVIHRVHESPDEEALDELKALFGRFGLLDSAKSRLGVRELQQVLEAAKGHRAERLIHMRALRAMKQARYEAASLGHFALAFEAYLHFTSPIRRYADLVVHRALKARLAGRPGAQLQALTHLAARLSALERRAVAAERDMLDLKKAALMAGRLGEKFEGVVTGAAEQGVYVTLDHPFVEGLVPGRELPPGATWDAAAQTWRTGRGESRLGIGERLQVQVVAVDPLKGWVNFRLLDEHGEARPVADLRKGRPRGRPARAKDAPTRGRGRRRRP